MVRHPKLRNDDILRVIGDGEATFNQVDDRLADLGVDAAQGTVYTRLGTLVASGVLLKRYGDFNRAYYRKPASEAEAR